MTEKNANLLSQVFDTFATKVSEGDNAKQLAERRATFVIDASLCVPGSFAEDFELTIRSLSPEDELAAMNEAGAVPAALAQSYAKRSLYAVNGTPIARGRGEDSFLWRALGQGGRQMVLQMFSTVAGIDQQAVETAKKSLRLH